MIAAEVGERVIIDAHVAADPLVVDLVATEFLEQACAAHTAGGGVEPQGEEDPGIDGGASGVALDGLDALIERREIGGEGIVPDDPHGVFLGDQFVERCGAEADLIAHGGLEPRGPDERGLGFVGPRLGVGFVGQIEEHGWIDHEGLGCYPRSHCSDIFITCQFHFCDRRFFHRL